MTHTLGDARVVRWAGYAGIGGALALFTGDLLLYGHFGSADAFVAEMRAAVLAASPERLYAGGLLGPLGALLYLAGYWHVYRQVHVRAAIAGRIMYASFCAFSLAAGMFHALMTDQELLMRACVAPDVACSSLLASMRGYHHAAYAAAEVPGYLGTTLLGVLVITGRTNYPRWTVLANPGLLMLIEPAFDHLPAPLGAVVFGSYVNLAVAAFFIVSLIVTRKRPRADAS